MPLAPIPWLITDLTPEVIKALDGSIQTGVGRDGSRAPGLSVPTAPAFTVSKTDTGITAIITGANGAESYESSVNGVTWVSGLTVRGLTADTPYTIQVRGINVTGTGPASAPVSFTTNSAGSNAPMRVNLAANSIDPVSWQAVLGAEFDTVETFDHVADYNGGWGSSVIPDELPKLTNGAQSMWQRFTNDRVSVGVASNAGFQPSATDGEWVAFGNGARGKLVKSYTEASQQYLQFDKVSGKIVVGDVATGETSGATTATQYIPDWIRDHGESYTFKGGKSACINYNDFQNSIDGFGPSRWEIFLGNGETGKSGYQKIHVFFMLKFDEDFFSRYVNGDGVEQFSSVGTLKFMEIETGFTAIDYFGTPEERATVRDLPKHLRDYGTNITFINTKGGGGSTPQSLFFFESRLTAKLWSNGWGYEFERTDRIGSGANQPGDWADMYTSGQWMGVEMILDAGTVDNADGASPEMYIYDETGAEIHYVAPAINQAVVKHFDHRYNKIVFGGNRLGQGYGVSLSEYRSSRYYIDDVIVHSARIAPTYFQKLAEIKGPL